MDNNHKYMVCTLCWTYNHKPFILDSLTGFSKQKTSFHTITVIVDDASTDGEVEILRQWADDNLDFNDSESYKKEKTYGDLLFAKHKNFPNLYFAILLLAENHYQTGKNSLKFEYTAEWREASKYLAICEGDDYWIDPLKLEKQVDFMEENPDYSLCFSDVYRKDLDSGKYVRPFSQTCDNLKVNAINNKEEQFYAIINRVCRIPTLTALFRNSSSDLIRKDSDQTFMMGDTPTWINLSQLGRFKYFDDVFGIYCIHRGSATHDSKTRIQFTMSAKSMCVFYCKKFNYKIPRKLMNEYNRAYINLLLEGKNPMQNALVPMFPDAVFSWAVNEDGEIKYKKKFQFAVIRVLFKIESFLYENKIRALIWLKAVLKRKKTNEQHS